MNFLILLKYLIKCETKWIPLIIIVAISACLWQLSPLEGLNVPAWQTVIIFVATIVAIVCKVGEIGLLGIVSMTVCALTYAGELKTMLVRLKMRFHNSVAH